MPNLSEAIALAVQHHQAERLTEAEFIYTRILETIPDCADALHLLGLIRRRQGRPEEALALIDKAIALQPHIPAMLGNRANILTDLGRHSDALSAYWAAAQQMPDQYDLMLRLGNCLWVQEKYSLAIDIYRRGIALNPTLPDFYYNMGVAWQRQGEQSLAERAFRDCLRVDPRHVAAWNSLGTVLRRQGKMDEAIAAQTASVTIQPDYWEGHKCLGLTLLLAGDMVNGLRHYEERRKTDEGRTVTLPRPEWDGSPLGTRTIVVHAEQGLGDTLNFIRYVPLLKRRYGGTVIFGCPDPLRRLLSSLPDIDVLAAFNQPLPPFDVHIPLLSLPRLMGTTLDTIPPSDPPLAASPELVAQWRARLGPRDGRLRVGVVWSGNPDFKNNRFRSPGLRAFLPLLAIPGVQFYVVQKGGGRDEMARYSLPDSVCDLGPELGDFADTAAVVENLDLVISMCTSVVHLVGSMVRPVWVVLSCTPDWRWLLDRADSPWYPTARLFRQQTAGDWNTVMLEVETALRARVSQGIRAIQVEGVDPCRS